MNFLKTGKAVYEEVERADALTASLFGPMRFFLKQGQEARITFLDGNIVEGLLATTSWYEHMVPRPGKKQFDNYPCTQDTEACPLCEDQNSNALVFGFTVLDHRLWTDKNGKEHRHEKRLFVCKRQTFKLLQTKAQKQNGLAGVTFDVTRIGDKSPAVGSDFDTVGKSTMEVIAEGCNLKIEDLNPLDYAEVVKYYPAAELRKMGFGVKGATGQASVQHAQQTAGQTGGLFGTKGGGAGFDPSKEL